MRVLEHAKADERDEVAQEFIRAHSDTELKTLAHSDAGKGALALAVNELGQGSVHKHEAQDAARVGDALGQKIALKVNTGWAAVSGAIHTVLDVAGFIPGLGAIPDLVNAGIYAAEGDWANAALSSTAAVPLAGDAIKGGAMAVKAGREVLAHGDDVLDVGKQVVKHGDEVVDASKVGKTAKLAPADKVSGPLVQFGQKRVGPNFGVDKRPDYLAGRSISDVASDLRSGKLHPDQLPIEAFRVGDKLVSANTRSLAALSEAGLAPTKVNVIAPTPSLLRRLRETPIIDNAPLPGTRVPVTPSQSDLQVLRVIELPRQP